MAEEELEQLKKKMRENSLGISRIDKSVKLRFLDVATNFCDDYGQALKWCLEQAIEYQEAKKIFFKIYELEKRIDILEKHSEITEEEPKVRKTLGNKQ